MNTGDPSVKVVFLGESGSGKTSIINRYIDRAFSPLTSPTIGCFGRTVPYEYKGQTINLNIWDTAGQEIYRSLTPMYYRNANVAVVVFDVTNRGSFDQVSGWVAELLANIGTIILIICGNKADLSKQRVVNELDAAALAQSSSALYLETSALTGYGLDGLFQTVIRQTVEAKPEARPRPGEDPAALVERDGKSGCC
jgi:small GTP-binding protein